jgi:DNA-binding SARP family transcriptional activator/tetratricopeptide (TPR) repeat protein
METAMEMGDPGQVPVRSALHVQLLGPLTISRNDIALPLPASRKVRALIAFLALAPNPPTRSTLCELLWDIPNDPRGELRWCLSKIRGVLDEPDRRRVESSGEFIRFDLTDCTVDANEIIRATQEGIETLEPGPLRALSLLFKGDFLEGLTLDRHPAFSGWLASQRRRFRACHTALLEHLVKGISDSEITIYLDKWLELDPFDQRVHQIMLTTLARRGHIREGEEHLAATARLFEAEGLDSAPLRGHWKSVRARTDAFPRVHSASSGRMEQLTSVPAEIIEVAPRRASIAVMPFVDRTEAAVTRGGVGHGLVHDIITRLAKLRTHFVIAQGTVFSLHERNVDPADVGRMLNVDYVVSGSLHLKGKRFTVKVELAQTRTAYVVWTEVFDQSTDDALLVLDEIGDRIVASIAAEIETVERNRAILRPPNSLDAWEAHHRGLWHMYRFTRADNERARHFFDTAVRIDPTFSQAYAGLSFTHFQNAFQGWAKREDEIDQAFEFAAQSVMVDDRDPAAHLAMGRALWLKGHQDRSALELEHAIDLSPNFAFGYYTLAFIHSQGGDPSAAIRYSDQSRRLSPFDPLLFAMLGARAMALARLGQFDEAAEWAVKAAGRPNAHNHVMAIAAHCLALAGRLTEARAYMAAIHTALPAYGVDDLLTAMQFAPEGAALFRDAAKRIFAG